MSAGKLGGDFGPRDMALIPGRDYPIGGQPGFGFDNDEYKPFPDIDMPSPPGYQQPPGGGGQQPQQGPGQYYQQMRESMQGMDKALKELEGMQMPGGQYQQPGNGYSPGSGGGGKGSKGISF
jgi:hypothetical protein